VIIDWNGGLLIDQQAICRRVAVEVEIHRSMSNGIQDKVSSTKDASFHRRGKRPADSATLHDTGVKKK
jgi:hypothetical protein